MQKGMLFASPEYDGKFVQKRSMSVCDMDAEKFTLSGRFAKFTFGVI